MFYKYFRFLPDEAKVIDIALKLDADFDRQVLDGQVTLTVERVKKDVTSVVRGKCPINWQKED